MQGGRAETAFLLVVEGAKPLHLLRRRRHLTPQAHLPRRRRNRQRSWHQPPAPQVQSIVVPFLPLAIAILAGVAGAFVSARSEASSALPGVGIAVALVPPLATIGMTIGLGQIDLAIGATLLYLTNLVGIILAATISRPACSKRR